MNQQNHNQLDTTGSYVILPMYYSYGAHNVLFEQKADSFSCMKKMTLKK